MPPTTQPLQFRPFAAADAALLGAWLASAGLGVPPGVAGRTWATRLIRDPNISCWAAVEHGRVVGFFRLDTGPDRQAEMTIIVAPGMRRRGIGRRLLEQALGQGRSRGLRKIFAVVAEGNGDALEFFHDAGFVRNGSKTPGNIHLQRLLHRAERQPPLEIQP